MWFVFFFFFFKQKTAYEMRISDWSSDVCSSDLHRIVLTGASGWLGRATSDLLQNALGDAFAERVFCFGSRQAELRLSETQLIMQRPLADLIKLPYQPTYLLPFAFLTKDRAETMQEQDYCAANRAIPPSVLDAFDPIETGRESCQENMYQ